MIIDPIDRKIHIRLIIIYLKYQNAFYFKYNNYKFWKKHMIEVTNIKNDRILRSLFYSLLFKKVFSKVKQGKKTLYLFNPSKKPLENLNTKKQIIVYFD
jgi:hypothetical protein